MTILDLRWLGFAVLCLALLSIGAVVWAFRRRSDTGATAVASLSTELQRTQKANRAFISDLGHELRTPIATVLTHLEILGLADVGRDVQAQSLQLARQEAQRMSRLVDDMLELGRLEMAETLARRPLSLEALVQDVVAQTLPRAVAASVRIEVTSPPSLPLVLGHEDRLRQVLLNLLDNAMKYTTGATQPARAAAHVRIELARVAGGVACEVCDSGPGILPEDLPFVANRFYRAGDGEVEGSGLGLALVAEILRHHKSELTLTSSVGEDHGTSARFVLPLAATERGPQA